jgi:hypothetical protein
MDATLKIRWSAGAQVCASIVRSSVLMSIHNDMSFFAMPIQCKIQDIRWVPGRVNYWSPDHGQAGLRIYRPYPVHPIKELQSLA